jgi:hypothetical protein
VASSQIVTFIALSLESRLDGYELGGCRGKGFEHWAWTVFEGLKSVEAVFAD